VGEHKEVVKINKLSLELRPRLEKKMIMFTKVKDFLILDFLDTGDITHHSRRLQDRQCTYNVALRRVLATIVVVENQ
jgi:hypothetical protein